MARVELRDQWVVAEDIQIVQQKLLFFFAAHKMKVKYQTEQMLVVRQGSQFKTRFMGGIAVTPETLPKKATVALALTPAGAQLDVVIEEALGFGSIVGLKQKYADYFAVWLQTLKQVLV